MITIKVRSKSGMINDISVDEIIEIDGKTYTPSTDIEQLICIVNQLSGRITTLENILSKGE